nr:pentatricopeptide repeat-containing protein [Tanacetum cinerariifolium]
MTIHGNRKKDASNMSFVELLSWAEEEVQIGNSHDMNVVSKGKTLVNDDSQVENVADKGKSTMNDDAIPVKKAVDKGKSKMIQDDHPVKNPIREGELIDLRKRKTEVKKALNSTNQKTLPDMVGSSSGIRQMRVYEVGDSETIIEHKEFMDDLIRKVKDGGDVMTDPFKILESKVEKYPIHDVGEKFDDVDQLKECLTYYALANGFSLWFYRSSNTQLIARCGLRPEKLKDPEKGKQRKWKRYPSTGEVEGASCPFRCYGKEMTDEKSFQSYGKAILESNPGSIVKVGVTVNPDDKTYFDRFYVCFKGLKEGWKLGCRKVIALDGCFLKKPNNKDNWRWFLDLLGDDLDMPNGNGLTLMSEQHKGLTEAVKEVMPHAEHRKCARHSYEDICPYIQKRLELTKDLHMFWHVIPTGGQLFEVRNGSQAFGVDEKRGTCTCRLWKLSGI